MKYKLWVILIDGEQVDSVACFQHMNSDDVRKYISDTFNYENFQIEFVGYLPVESSLDTY